VTVSSVLSGPTPTAYRHERDVAATIRHSDAAMHVRGIELAPNEFVMSLDGINHP